MARLESGDCTPKCTSDNLTITLETILKDKKNISREEQTAFECYRTRPSPSLQATSDQILTPQNADNPHIYRAQVCYSEWASPLEKKGDSYFVCWENSNQRHAGQNSSHGDYTSLFSGKNDPLNLTVHRTVNSTTHNIRHNWLQQVSSVNTLPNNRVQRRTPIDHITFRPSVSHQAGLGNESSKTCTSTYKSNLELPSQPAVNVQSNVLNASKMQESIPLKKRKPYFVTVTADNPGYEFIAENIVLAEDQMVSPDKSYLKRTLDNGIRLCNKQFGKRNLGTCVVSTQPHQKMYIAQKAIAVVAPLAPEAVECDKSSENSTKVHEGGLKTRPVAEKPYHQRPLQSRTNNHASAPCSTSCSVAQTHYRSPEIPTQSIPASPEPEDPVQANELSHQRQSLYSVPVGSISMRNESIQQSDMDNRCSAGCVREEVTTTNKSNDGSENAMDTAATDKWSLKRLHKLIIDLEKRQRMTHKEVPFTDLSSEIVKRFWNGDYQKLCDTARSDHYANIMKEVVLYRGKENPVILQELSKEKFDRGAEDVHNSKQNPVLPTVVSESSVLNLHKELRDSSKKRGDLSCLMNTAEVAADEVTVEGSEIMQVAENKKTKASNEAAGGTGAFSLAQSQLLTLHEENSKSIVGDGVLTSKPVDMDIENKGACSNRETVGQEKPLLVCLSKPISAVSFDDSKPVPVNRAAGEELFEMEGENKTARSEVSVHVSLNKQSATVSNNCMHVNPEDQPPTEMISPLDDCNNADSTDRCAFLKISVLSPDPAKQMSTSEPNEEVKTRHKDVSGETITKKTDQAIVKPHDCGPEDEAHAHIRTKPAENTGHHTTNQLEKYCCLNKWIQVLGYAGGMRCTCERNSGKGVMEGTSMTGRNMVASPTPGDGIMDELEIVEVISDYENVRKIANAISDQQMDKPLRKCGPRAAKKKEEYCTYDACRKKRTHPTSCGQFTTKADLIPNFSNDSSQMDLSLPTHGLQIDEKGKKTTTPEVQNEERMVNLALYGTSGRTHNRTVAVNSLTKKRIFGIRSYDGEHFPPATLNVRVSPSLTDVNSNKRQTAKQHVLKSWRNSLVTTQMFTDRKRSKKLKCQRGIKSQTEAAGTPGIETSTFPTAFDAVKTLLSNQHHFQTRKSEITFPTDQQNNPAGHSRIKRHSTRRGQIKKRILELNNLTSGPNIHKRKSTGSSCELPCTLKRSKPESRKGLALDFRVLPESFSFTDASTSMKVHPSSNTDYGQKTKAEKSKNRALVNPGVWCVSPKKKGHLNSILASDVTGSASTFQEFKRRYEEKKQILHPKANGNKKISKEIV